MDWFMHHQVIFALFARNASISILDLITYKGMSVPITMTKARTILPFERSCHNALKVELEAGENGSGVEVTMFSPYSTIIFSFISCMFAKHLHLSFILRASCGHERYVRRYPHWDGVRSGSLWRYPCGSADGLGSRFRSLVDVFCKMLFIHKKEL